MYLTCKVDHLVIWRKRIGRPILTALAMEGIRGIPSFLRVLLAAWSNLLATFSCFRLICTIGFLAKLKFCFRTTEVQEIRDAFDAVKIAKSFGTDNISSYFLKFALYFIENSLAISFDIFLETNQFPVAWKIVRVNAIFKDGERTEKSNYRPISVLPVISRLFFEKLVTKQLNQTVSFLMTSQAFCAFGLQ